MLGLVTQLEDDDGCWRSEFCGSAKFSAKCKLNHPRIVGVQVPVCCFGGSLILMEYKVLRVLQHVEDSKELLLLLCIQGAYTVVESWSAGGSCCIVLSANVVHHG